MAKRSNNWERQNKDSFRENRNKTRYMSKKSAKGLRDLVFICRSINRAVYTGKKRKALSGLNNWVVTMFFFILIKWLRRDVFFPLLMKYEIFILFLHRAWTMSPEQSQYIWRKTIPHIEVGMGSGVFTSHRSARFVLISDWWTRRKMELLDFVVTRPRLPVQRTKSPPAASGWEGS